MTIDPSVILRVFDVYISATVTGLGWGTALCLILSVPKLTRGFQRVIVAVIKETR